MSEAYLLPAQTLLDLCSGEDNGARAWAPAVPTAKLRVSVVSVAQARAFIEAMTDTSGRRALNNRLNQLLATIVADGGPPLPLDEQVATVWQGLNLDSKLDREKVQQTARQVYATALTHSLAVVERARPHHDYLHKLGLEVVAL